MRLQITSWRHVLIYSVLITVLAVSVPLTIVSITLGALPMIFKFPILVISGLIPLFITFPIAVFALHIFKKVNATVATLNSLVKFDTLTGLLSRAHFMHTFGERRKRGGFLAIVDADHFKRVNDTFGHEAGDDALKYLATAMTQTVGNAGIVGRLGGEEFAIYLPGVMREQAKLIAAALGSALRNQSFHYRGQIIPISVSIGLVVDEPDSDIAATFRRGDMLLYQAKRNGRDRYEIEELLLDGRSVSAA
jgi:diguanylate cyclase